MSNYITELPAVGGRIVANERLWLTAGRDHVVPEGHPDAAFLFASVGKSIPRREAERLGLVETSTNEEVEEVKEKTVVFGGESVTKEDTETMTDEEEETAGESSEESDAPDDLSYRELQDRCKEAGISAFGSRDTLLKRLADAESTDVEEEDEE